MTERWLKTCIGCGVVVDPYQWCEECYEAMKDDQEVSDE